MLHVLQRLDPLPSRLEPQGLLRAFMQPLAIEGNTLMAQDVVLRRSTYRIAVYVVQLHLPSIWVD